MAIKLGFRSSITLILFSLASFPAGAMVNCADLLTKFETARQSLKQAADASESEKKALQNELTQPEKFRVKKDPRWLSWFRDATKNPVTVDLKEQVKNRDERLAKLRQQAGLLAEFNALYPTLDRLPRDIIDSNPQRKQGLKDWMLRRAFELSDDFQIEAKDQQQIEALKKSLMALKSDLDVLNDPRQSAAQTDVLRRYTQEQRNFRIGDASQLIQNILGRGLRESLVLQLIAISDHFDVSLERALWAFKRMDDIGLEQRGGINDRYLALLTRTSLERKVLPETVVEMFIQVDRLGRELKSNFHIPDLEVAMLTDIAFEFNLSPQSIAARFFEFEYLGRTYKGTGNFTHLNDSAITVLTRASLMKLGASPQQMIKSYFQAYDQGRLTLPKFYINDLGLAILTQSSGVHRQSVDKMNSRFFEIHAEFKRVLQREGADEDYAKLADLSFAFQIPPAHLLELAGMLEYIVGHKMPINNIKSILSLALARSQSSGRGHSPTIKDLRHLALIDSENPGLLIDLLEDSHRVSTSLSSSPSSSMSRSRSNGVAPSSNLKTESPFGLTLDFNEGIKPSLNLGSGLSLDSTDGSLTIDLGNGLRMDTDGDGLGVKLF